MLSIAWDGFMKCLGRIDITFSGVFGIPRLNNLRIQQGKSSTASIKLFLLKLSGDRLRWLQWLYETGDRYGSLKHALQFLLGGDSFRLTWNTHGRITDMEFVLPLDKMTAEDKLAAME
jgi:hypothetical protein